MTNEKMRKGICTYIWSYSNGVPFYVTKTGTLWNLTDGGEGMLGHKHSPTSLAKISSTRRFLAKLIPNYGTSDLARRAASQRLKGEVPWNKGVPRSEETKRKIRETRQLNNSNKPTIGFSGRKHNSTSKEKVSLSLHLHYALGAPGPNKGKKMRRNRKGMFC